MLLAQQSACHNQFVKKYSTIAKHRSIPESNHPIIGQEFDQGHCCTHRILDEAGIAVRFIDLLN